MLDPLKSERKGFNTMFDEKRKEMEPLQQALGKLRSNDGGSARGPAICSSEEELNNMVTIDFFARYSLSFYIFFNWLLLDSHLLGFVKNEDIQLPISDST